MKIGTKAPSFSLPDSNGKDHNPKDYLGKKVVLYFYPKDNTPGCTLEAQDFTKLKKEFEKQNTVILGVSKDSCKSHAKFTEKQNLSITLLSDDSLNVQKSYGVWQKKKFMGKEFMGTVRTTFLIDDEGKIEKVWEKVRAKDHAKEVLNYIIGKK